MTPSRRTGDPADLRTSLRTARSGLSEAEQMAAASAVCGRLAGLEELAATSCVAVYNAVRGELRLDPTIDMLRSRGITTAFPRIGDAMTFHAIGAESELVPGVLGIAAPSDSAPEAPKLDAVLVPLVAFDQKRNRVGMGGGYYDRFFAPERWTAIARPTLIGVAHDLQRVVALDPNPWDVRLNLVVTPSGITR